MTSSNFQKTVQRTVVIGTGTGVGKTHASVSLLHVLCRRNLNAVGLKPVESGLGVGISDGEKLKAASAFHVKQPAPYRFIDAVSPHLAARRQGCVIELERICSWINSAGSSWVVVETAGGLLSPLGPQLTNLDLVRLLKPDCLLLVGLDRLGVLHEITACQIALRFLAPEITNPIVVLNAPEQTDSSSGTNADELLRLGIAQKVFFLPREQPDHPASLNALDVLFHTS